MMMVMFVLMMAVCTALALVVMMMLMLLVMMMFVYHMQFCFDFCCKGRRPLLQPGCKNGRLRYSLLGIYR